MPGFNQRGPLGQGPMTGRRLGRCTNFGANLNNQTAETKENTNENLSENFQGRGFGFGRGMGFGRGRGGRGFGMGRQNRFRGGQ
ncbi:MAG: hypothetical protein Kow0068_14840 [Marinilabiliales bacterium]